MNGVKREMQGEKRIRVEEEVLHLGKNKSDYSPCSQGHHLQFFFRSQE